MKNFITYIFFFLAFISENGYSQACGGGKLNFDIFTINGQEIENFEYEIFPVSEENLKEKFLKKVLNESNLDDPKNYFLTNINNTGIIINEQHANEIITTIDEKLNESFKKLLANSKISSKGEIKSSLTFNTFENINLPIILKVTHKKRTVYILGNYFGGCNRNASLIWNKYYSKLN